MQAIIVSLSKNPGHLSHLIAGYKLCEELGYTSYLYIDESLFKYISTDDIQYFTYKNVPSKIYSEETIILFWSPSIRNIKEIFKFKLHSKFKPKIGYVFHEPFDSIKNYYNAGFNVQKIIKTILSSIVNVLILSLSTFVLLPSLKSYKLYYLNKLNHINKKAYLFSLILDDETLCHNQKNSIKTKISYIGTIAEDHAFKEFIIFVKYSIENELLLDFEFLIATKSTLVGYQELIEPFVNSKRIKIISGSPLTNTEINQCFHDSAIVWNAYHRSNQSGVLSKAFMFGTPIIVLEKNKNEYTEDRKNCILIEDNKSIDEILSAVDLISSKLPEYSKNCKNTFIEHFYYKNKIKCFQDIITKDNVSI